MAVLDVQTDSQTHFERLMVLEPYSPHDDYTDALFMRALAEQIAAHADGNSLYARFLARKGFDPRCPFRLEELPYLPARLFKLIGGKLATVPEEEISLSLMSSATSGVPSTVPINRATARRQARSMAKVLADFIGKERRPFLVLDTDPAHARDRASYGARGAAVRGYMNFASRADFFMEEQGGLVFNEDKFRNAVAALDSDTPVTLFGFTYVIYAHIARPAAERGLAFHLPPGSFLIHIGGWKKLENEKVSRQVFNEMAEATFGIDPERIIDIYGFTEQMGLNYPDCACGCKHAPHMSRVIVRDPVTHEPLPAGRAGILEFISPLEQSYAGAAVLTDDIGRIVPGECLAGRSGQRFQVLGRLKKTEARGCGDIMGEKMRNPGAIIPDAESSQIRMEAWGSDPADLADLFTSVRAGVSWLQQQSSEAIIGLISETASSWMDDPCLASMRYNGLSFLSRWCQASNLYALANQALREMPGCLDGFVPEKARKSHFLRAFPLGIVVHWVSGNVPFLAMLVLAQSLLAKNGNIIKTAANNFDLLHNLLQTFAGRAYTDSRGVTVHGEDLLKSIALVHYPHTNTEAAAALSKQANCRIAWGGRDAIEAICALPARAEVVDLVFGPKTSFMVIAADALDGEKAALSLMRRAATDVSSFDQTACSSPHTIFVEKGGIISPRQFAEQLGEYMERAAALIPGGSEDEATLASVQNARAIGEFMGECWAGNGWTVLYDDNTGLAAPVYARTITVRPVDDIMDTIGLIDRGIQTIGLAVKGERRFEYAARAGAAGAMRFPEIGLMTGFDAPWDGVFILDRLVRWVSVGGMASAIATC